MTGTKPEVSSEQGLPTLDDALRLVGSPLRLADWSAAAASRRFVGIAYWEPGAEATELAGRIVLGVGLDAEDGDALAGVLTQIAAADGAALMIRTPAGTDGRAGMVDAGPRSAAETALLLLSEDADWTQVASTLRALCIPQTRDLVSAIALGDLFTFANTLATVVGEAVSIVDATGQVVGYSTHADQPIDEVRRQATLSLREAIPLSQDPDYTAVLAAATAIYVPAPEGQYGRVARAIRSSGELLGTVWIVQPEEGFADDAGRLLDAAEPLVAQHLLEARAGAAQRQRRAADLLHALVDDDTSAVRRAAAELLLPPDVRHTVLCAGGPGSADNPTLHLHQLLRLVNAVAPAHFTRSYSAIVGHHVATLVVESDPDRLRRYAEHLARRDPTAAVGIGRPSTIARIARSHRDAASALSAVLSTAGTAGSVAGRSDGGRVAAIDEVSARLGLIRVGAYLSDLEVCDGDDADRLLAHDVRTGSELASTLLTYLQTQQSVRRTAELLHVHQNTIRYRLDTVGQELAIDLHDPTTRLWLWLRLSTADLPDGVVPRRGVAETTLRRPSDRTGAR